MRNDCSSHVLLAVVGLLAGSLGAARAERPEALEEMERAAERVQREMHPNPYGDPLLRRSHAEAAFKRIGAKPGGSLGAWRDEGPHRLTVPNIFVAGGFYFPLPSKSSTWSGRIHSLAVGRVCHPG